MADRAVIDASAVAAMIFEEPEANQIRSAFDNYSLFAPFLLPVELANVCVKKIRRMPDRTAELMRMHAVVPTLEIELFEVDQLSLPTLALQHRLSAYDASYLLLALDHGTRLITLDRKLQTAFEAALRCH